jgi:glycine/D-amino acid oxidase-like deaminating enzyme
MAEFVIVGAGLAGTTLAWAIVRRGRTVRVIDREPASSTSRVAAGLMTPITGKKPAVSWRWHDLRPAAERFYREVEETTGGRFFHPRPVVRVMTGEKEREAFTRREFAGLVTTPDPPPDAAVVPQPFGAVLMPTAAQLDTGGYLKCSRDYFRDRGWYDRGEFTRPTTAAIVILCHGYDPPTDRLYPLPFRAAKGEILTVRIPRLEEVRALNRGGWWLAPTGTPHEYRFGATYSWDVLDDVPTVTGRDELASKLGELVRLPFEMVGHAAGVRPVVAGRKPVLGVHPDDPRLAVFNGLSSKGSLSAPYFAEMLAAHLCDGTPIDPEVDVRHRTQHP